MRPSRVLLLVPLAALAVASGCGGSSAEDGAAYADAVEAIVEEDVTPDATEASDVIVNVSQGSDAEEAVDELKRIADSLRESERELGELAPPEEAAEAASQLALLIGSLAENLEGVVAPGFEPRAAGYAATVRAYIDGIQGLADATEDLAETTAD